MKRSKWALAAAQGAFAGAAFVLAGIQGAAAANHRSGMSDIDGMRHDSRAAGFAFGEPEKADHADRAIDVTMNTMSFDPASLKVAVGETEHRAEMAEAMKRGGGMAHGDDPNAMTVKAGESRELTWKFTRTGRFEFDCNVPGHYEAGMRGGIVVAGRRAGQS